MPAGGSVAGVSASSSAVVPDFLERVRGVRVSAVAAARLTRLRLAGLAAPFSAPALSAFAAIRAPASSRAVVLGSHALGRLRGYQLLLQDDNPFGKPIVPVLVTNKRDSEVARLAEDLKIAYEVVT